MSAGLSKKAAKDRIALIAAAEVLDEAQDLESIEKALAAATLVGVPDDAPEVLAALGRRAARRSELERSAVVEALQSAADCEPSRCDVEEVENAVQEARLLGVSASSVLAAASKKSEAILSEVDVDEASAVAAAVIFHDEAHELYDEFRPPPPVKPDDQVIPDL